MIVAISILGTSQAYGQVAGAMLTGTVKDASGGFIPNAQVAITDVATSVTHDIRMQAGLPFFHLPNAGPIGNGDTGLFTFVRQQVVSENYFTTRVDQKISEKDEVQQGRMKNAASIGHRHLRIW